MARQARAKMDGEGFYHVISRIGGREFRLDDTEKRLFLAEIRRAAVFSGVEVYSHAMMGNHFHLLVRVPERGEIDETELRRRLLALYGEKEYGKIAGRWARWREQGKAEAVEEEQSRYKARMHDLSQFCKTFKQRYTQNYNKRKKHTGTIWEERFKSVVVDGSQEAMSAVAAYIHMNPVRAGMAPTAMAAWNTSLGAGVAGEEASREGLRALASRMTGEPASRLKWADVLEMFAGAIEGRAGTVAAGVSVQELVARRRAAFTNGLALGRAEFAARFRTKNPDGAPFTCGESGPATARLVKACPRQ